MATRGRGERRECPVPTQTGRCGGYTAPGQLMCRHHWRRVPTGLRTEVWRTWGRWQETHQDTDWTAYLAARDDALGAVTP